MKRLANLAIILSLSGLAAKGQQADPSEIRNAVEKGVAVLQKTGPEFVKKSGCVSCHHQAVPAMATGMAKDRGYQFDPKAAEQARKAVLGFVRPAREVLMEGSDVVPDVPVTGSYLLMGLAAEKYPADDVTAAIVHNIALRQNADGSWTGWSPRPPIEFGDLRSTALSLRALDLYSPKGRRQEMNSRIERARNWLIQTKPATEEERIMRLAGLTWGKASAEDIRMAAGEVLAAQRPDGGWAQLATLESDAYATGEALVALHESGVSSASPAYQRGVRYLLERQTEDGSWRVKTRAFPFQPLVDTGFPHGRDQWISAAATAWSTMALMLSTEPMQAKVN